RRRSEHAQLVGRVRQWIAEARERRRALPAVAKPWRGGIERDGGGRGLREAARRGQAAVPVVGLAVQTWPAVHGRAGGAASPAVAGVGGADIGVRVAWRARGRR